MEGYDVVTADEQKIGKVVGQSGDFLIVERGTLLKSKHPLPRELAHVDDSEQQVRVTVPKEIVADSPKIEDGGFDERAAAEHYGLSSSPGPGAEGYGEMPEPAEEERARIREGGEQTGLQESSPALLGDRLAGIDEREQEER
jgi:hypothetical protein